jgi:hypothetical protein
VEEVTSVSADLPLSRDFKAHSSERVIPRVSIIRLRNFKKRRPRPDLGCSAIGWMDYNLSLIKRFNICLPLPALWPVPVQNYLLKL